MFWPHNGTLNAGLYPLGKLAAFIAQHIITTPQAWHTSSHRGATTWSLPQKSWCETAVTCEHPEILGDSSIGLLWQGPACHHWDLLSMHAGSPMQHKQIPLLNPAANSASCLGALGLVHRGLICLVPGSLCLPTASMIGPVSPLLSAVAFSMNQWDLCNLLMNSGSCLFAGQ